jgi:hypothetical protein
MHGYQPAAIQPTTALVMSHKHPDNATKVALLDVPGSVRERADHLLLTAHKRVGDPLGQRADK